MTYYITTPIFYVNDLPHIGSAYPTIACDFFAGHMRQRGIDTAFLTGTDEHGQKIEKAAASQNKNPQEHCDYISEEFKKLWELLDIDYQFFVRTSSAEHKKFVADFFTKVQASGDIYVGDYKGLYCVSCEDFWLEKDLGEGNTCPTHKTKVEEYSQKNYFFKLSKYEERLKQYINDNPEFICPEYRRNEVLGWFKEGLKDFPISRVGLEWGIPVPGDNEGQKIYVWFDALLSYISGLGDKKDKYWKNDASGKIVHVIGKDILRFHAIYWPAMLMSAEYPLPAKVFGHGFLTKDGMKMGKTLGNVIDPIALSEKFGPEAVKFYFLREIMFGRDGDYTDESFILRLNSDLANNLGNLLNRALKLVNKNFGGKVPSFGLDPALEAEFKQAHETILGAIDNLDSFLALETVFKMLDKVNADINVKEPWKLLKNAEPGSVEFKTAGISLATAAEACKRAAFYLAPLMPNLSVKIFSNLGLLKDSNQERSTILASIFNLTRIDDSLEGIEINPNTEAIFQRLELDANKATASI